ncbi:MAG: nitrogen regulatory protein 2 [Clostridia bacterium]|jgi:nitrogen regulatory protein PII 2|nr:nitrogen regulatory protein 2 [Clostridia bacterium]MDN5322451.1 nitrogen regulatory protein 2 [Clostridia bacterium]
MKEIIAIIRMNKVAKTKDALVKAGFNGLTAAKVIGRGKKLKGLKLVPQVEEDIELRDALLESLLKGGRLIPKRMLTLIVKDKDVQKAVDTIISVNKEGKIGDGKIFVLPLQEVIRVRTGETGEEAV